MGLNGALKTDRPWRVIAGPELSPEVLALATLDPPRMPDGPPSDRFMWLVDAARPHCRCEYHAAKRRRDIDTADEPSADPFDIPAFLDRRTLTL